jgi:pilus assembly protein CpaE
MRLIGVIDSNAEYARGVAQLLGESLRADVRHIPDLVGAEQFVSDDSPQALVIGPSVAADDALLFGQRMAGVEPPVSIVLVAPSVNADLLRSALRSGLHDVIGSEDPASDLEHAVREAVESSERRGASPSVDAQQDPDKGKVVTVFSTKGGVGKSVLATNMGVALASTMRKKTVLVDLDLQFGDVGIMLGLQPAQTIADAASAFDRLDAELMDGILATHRSGLRTLLAPVQPEQAEGITPARITRIVSLLQEMFDFVVLDTAANLDETVLTALDRSNRVYAVTMMDIASIKNSRISLQKLRQLGYPSDALEVVLNRADSKVWLNPAEVERAIGRPIEIRIPSDRVVPRSVNKGTPVVLEAPRSDVSKTIVSLVKHTVDSLQEVAVDVA